MAGAVGHELSGQPEVADDAGTGAVVAPRQQADVFFQQRGVRTEMSEQDPQGADAGGEGSLRPPVAAAVGGEPGEYPAGLGRQRRQAALVHL
ncbi:hypothetical protein [Streptomyces umbrinus]|uniref:hypothetical protein n=1 Tax=Streptomyces umbrinus TaxID=67370 RepID=UPI0033D88B3F